MVKDSAASPGDTSAVLFEDESARWWDGRDHELLPAQARPAAVRRTWLLLAMALLGLAGVAVTIGAVL